MYARSGQETGMKAICGCCGHDWLLPKGWAERFHPPATANRFMVEGCRRCLDEGDTGSGAFWWRLEDGTEAGCLAGEDELEAQGITILDPHK